MGGEKGDRFIADTAEVMRGRFGGDEIKRNGSENESTAAAISLLVRCVSPASLTPSLAGLHFLEGSHYPHEFARYSYSDDKVLPDTGSWADTISSSISDLFVFEAAHGWGDV